MLLTLYGSSKKYSYGVRLIRVFSSSFTVANWPIVFSMRVFICSVSDLCSAYINITTTTINSGKEMGILLLIDTKTVC